jgi:hypothetical protein
MAEEEKNLAEKKPTGKSKAASAKRKKSAAKSKTASAGKGKTTTAKSKTSTGKSKIAAAKSKATKGKTLLSSDQNTKIIVAIGAALAVVTICCVIVLLVFMILDPFGWFGFIFGGGETIAEAIPPDAEMYLSLNMAGFLSGDAEVVIETIMGSIPDAEVAELEDMMGDMIDEIFYDLGLTFEEDIMPWIGQRAGIAMANVSFDIYGDIPEPDLIVAIEVRNRGAADDFIADYIAANEYEMDASYSSDDYRGATIYEAPTRMEAIARSGNILYFGNSSYAVENAIDAQKDDSLADEPDFEAIASQLPSDRFATIYLGSPIFDSYGDLIGLGVSGANPVPQVFQSIAMTFAFTDFGLQMDYFMGVDEDEFDDSQLDILTGAQPSGDIISSLPEDTVAFFVGQGLDQVWQGIVESMDLAYGGDFEQSMRFFADEFGFRPDLDLFPILDGEWGVAVLPGSTSELGQELAGLGVMLLAESSDEDELEDVANDSADALSSSGFDVREQSADGGTLYVAQSRGEEMFSFGTQDGVLLLGTDSGILLDTMEGTSSIEDDRTYRDVWGSFPRGTTPVLYLNLNSLLGNIVEYGYVDWEDLAWELGIDPRPFTHLAAGSGGLNRGVIRATIVIFVDTE